MKPTTKPKHSNGWVWWFIGAAMGLTTNHLDNRYALIIFILAAGLGVFLLARKYAAGRK